MAHSAYYIWFLTTVIVSHWHNWIETTHVINWDWKNSFKATIRVSCLTLFNQFILCCVWSTSTTTKTKKNEEVIGRFRVRVRESVFVWKRTRIHFNHIDACNRMNRFTSCWCNSFYIPVDLIPWKNGVIDEIEYHEMRSSILVFFFFFHFPGVFGDNKKCFAVKVNEKNINKYIEIISCQWITGEYNEWNGIPMCCFCMHLFHDNVVHFLCCCLWRMLKRFSIIEILKWHVVFFCSYYSKCSHSHTQKVDGSATTYCACAEWHIEKNYNKFRS